MAASRTSRARSAPPALPGNGSVAGPSSRLAVVVADQLIGMIGRAGWPEGEVIGSEAALLEQLGVSRAVLREAVRLLEHLGVAGMRRGPGGGLVVLPPSLDSLTDALTVYLVYTATEIEEVWAARLLLEGTAAELAPGRLTPDQEDKLLDLVAREKSGKADDHRELHRLMAEITGNPVFEVLVDLLNRASLIYLAGASRFAGSVLSASGHAHIAIADAVLAGDGQLAHRRMRKHLEAEAEYFRTRRPSRKRLARALASTESDKLAERTARQILSEVASSGWPVGELLGSEPELMARYDVSRAVLREAVRLLEHHQVARMRRGPGGGLFVTEPGIDAVVDALAVRLSREGTDPAQLFEVRVAVEMVVLDLALERLDDDGAELLRQAVEAERSASATDLALIGHDLHGVIAHVAGNRVLELLTRVLVRLTRTRSATADGARRLDTDEVTGVHGAIVEAMLAGDADRARRRMRKHLDALTRWVR